MENNDSLVGLNIDNLPSYTDEERSEEQSEDENSVNDLLNLQINPVFENENIDIEETEEDNDTSIEYIPVNYDTEYEDPDFVLPDSTDSTEGRESISVSERPVNRRLFSSPDDLGPSPVYFNTSNLLERPVNRRLTFSEDEDNTQSNSSDTEEIIEEIQTIPNLPRVQRTERGLRRRISAEEDDRDQPLIPYNNGTMTLANRKIPNEISNFFGMLKIVDFQYNDLNSLNILMTAVNLESLVITHNNIEVIPKEISNLKLLRFINLDSNKIFIIEEDGLDTLSNLGELNLNNNRLHLLTKNFGNLKLERLDLDDNAFLDIPTQVCNIKTLKVLSFI